MSRHSPSPLLSVPAEQSRHPRRAAVLRQLELLTTVIGMAALVVRRGLWETSEHPHWEIGIVVVASAVGMVASYVRRLTWCERPRVMIQQERAGGIAAAAWLAGIVAVLIFAPLLVSHFEHPFPRAHLVLVVSELFLVASTLIGIVTITRKASAEGINPVILLIASFAVLIAVGTTLLLLPQSRSQFADPAEPFGQRLQTALFTSTSASCVTGLVVESTGGAEPYWSRTGQTVIFCLFQIGGLGIMTCGAFFAVAAGRQLEMRESVALQNLLESNALGDVRRLLKAILVFTVGAELLGALFLSGLWADKPLGERAFYSVFHSVSAFCNAGFTLTDDSFVSQRDRWQVWGVATWLIIVGGFGFGALYNTWLVFRSRWKTLTHPPLFDLPAERLRLTLSTKVVWIATLSLLFGGALVYFLLESTAPTTDKSTIERLNEAWFQSVTFRTAGFNTVDHGQLQPATKLWAVFLMFIGASPGSTGGGVKTVAFAIAVLALFSTMRGRQNVELQGRTIPNMQVNRALAIMTMGVATLMATTLLLVVFEKQPERFIDFLYEATSACATVGVSTSTVVDGETISTTQSLSAPSRNVIILAMFLGRVGPLTMLMALAGRDTSARYTFPTERVVLG